jgi:hypothetical protein
MTAPCTSPNFAHSEAVQSVVTVPVFSPVVVEVRRERDRPCSAVSDASPDDPVAAGLALRDGWVTSAGLPGLLVLRGCPERGRG